VKIREFLPFFVFLASILFPFSSTHAIDIPITPTEPVWNFTASGDPGALTWGASSPSGFNNNFFFTPPSQNDSVCFYVKKQ
jgi:hypothetical protein